MTDAPQSSQQIIPFSLHAATELRPPQLPPELTSFIGREQELRELAASIVQPDVRLVTLIGAGGAGKTRLALRTIPELRSEFAAVGFAQLATVTNPELIVLAAGGALGIRTTSAKRLRDRLDGARVLLVLDNLEQIPGAARVLARLLHTCPSLSILAISRTVLHVSGEHIYRLPPLVAEAERTTPSPAIQLFTDRATAADPTFTLDTSTFETLPRFAGGSITCHMAIELAAGQIRCLAPQAILARLDRRFDLLVQGPADQPERLRSLERSIRWSYDLLSADHQRAFRRLGVFPGELSEDAASQIALDGAPALSLLATLIDASLVLRSLRPDGESRYALLESIRAFCLLELRAHGEEEPVWGTYTDYCLRHDAPPPPDRMPRSGRTSAITLSGREREVLACIIEGLHDREIAHRLCISPRTVQSHALAISNKLGAHSRPEAVAIALRSNLL